MTKASLCIGAKVIASPVGPGTITGFTETGIYPKVNQYGVAWAILEDETIFNPYKLDLSFCLEDSRYYQRT